MNKYTFTLGAALLMSTSSAFAGGLDRSGQSVLSVLEDGQFISFSTGYAMPNVSGTVYGSEADNMAESYFTLGMVSKADIGDNFSLAFIYDQPFGADAKYQDDLKAIQLAPGLSLPNPANGAEAHVSSHGMSIVTNLKVNPSVDLFFGPRIIVAKGSYENPNLPMKSNLSPLGSAPAKYELDAGSATGLGWVGGMAYSKSDIGLRFAVTYSSAVDLEFTAKETVNSVKSESRMDVTMPQSVNVDFQTGVNERTLVMAGLRWANWQEFKLAPDQYVAGTDKTVVEYSEDAMTYYVGGGYKVNDQISVAGRISFEEPIGGDFNPLSPTDGSTALSFGGSYDLGNYKIGAGINYTMLGDSDGKDTKLGVNHDFSGNSAFGFGMSVTTKF